MPANSRMSTFERLGSPMLWFGILGGPMAWSAHLLVSYGLVYVVRGTGWAFLLHLTTLTTALVALAAGIAAWRGWRHPPAENRAEMPDVAARRRFMGYIGLLLSGLFFLVILVEGTPPLFLDAGE